ncbi:hypothetical protein L6452_40305 [Arctium lappa]|uniref:Uncharacterized protein n=1 Tax=Arctium lappa TaxID=4217 RepID=A0ACB8XLK1_ARCLA|nr:hypothetical protein L6452_40305 [Arctium lappa]
MLICGNFLRIPPGGTYPAKDQFSKCGLCDTYYIAHVKNACAFLGDGMSRIESTLLSIECNVKYDLLINLFLYTPLS